MSFNTNCSGKVLRGSTRQPTPSSEVAVTVLGLLVAATSPAGPPASRICTGPDVRAGPRATAACGVHDRPSGEVHDTTGPAYGLMQEVLAQSVLTPCVSATSPDDTAAMPTTAMPGPNGFEMSPGKGSQRDPSCEVHKGVRGSVALASQPTAMNPRRQRSAHFTRLSGSRGPRRCQRTPDHAAEGAGGAATVKASATGPRRAPWAAMVGTLVAEMSPAECADGAGGETWAPHGFARASPTNTPTSSAAATAIVGPLGSAGTSLPGSGGGSITGRSDHGAGTVAAAHVSG